MTHSTLNIIIVLLILTTIICMACKSPVVASCFGGLAVLIAGFNLTSPVAVVAQHNHIPNVSNIQPSVPVTIQMANEEESNQQQPVTIQMASEEESNQQQPVYRADNESESTSDNAPCTDAQIANGNVICSTKSPNRLYKCPVNGDVNNTAVSPMPNNAYVGQLDQILTLEKRPIVLNYGVPRPSISNNYNHNYIPVPARALYDNPSTPYVNVNKNVYTLQPNNFNAEINGNMCGGNNNSATSREGSIACVVPELIGDDQSAMKDVIRNQGLYGIRGNLSCEKLRRNAKQDTRFIEPVGARNAWAAYNAYDQKHARDPFMIPAQQS